ncbi:MAG TPA: hypothetical protein VLZ28_02765, partial [Daejeonella sp.]|nr:hypothetical protein [Daejeonella sp.]
MKTLYTFLLVFTILPLFAQQSPYFASHPTLSPDAKTVVFSFEGDIWKSTLGQNNAVRLTAMQGDETNAKISPDGQWLAFSSTQFGNNDVYLMPLAGGDIKQLTFHDGNDEVDSWAWDSKTIYFTSSRYNNYTGYSVTVKGGTPKRLFNNYFNTVHNVAEHPKTGELFFNDTWESKNFAQRKRYKGAYNPDIQSYNPTTKKYTQYTDYDGKDFWTTIDRNGNIYFVSDEANQEYNLYTFQNGKKTQLTKFETSIKRPSVSANGEKIVFELDYKLYIYDVASKKTEPLQFSAFRNNILSKVQDFDIKNKIESFDVSPDGKKLAFISRGEIFVSDNEGKFIKKLERPDERALEVKWLKDNRTLLFNQTTKGFQNLFTISADGTGKLKQLTRDVRNNRSISLSPDRSIAVYLSGRDEVRVLNLTDLISKTIVKDEIWGFQNSVPSISPDNQFVLFTAIRNFEQDIFVHSLKTNKTINLTNTGVTEAGPVWSPDGLYIYFASSRTKPSYPYGMQDPRLYRVALQNMDGPFRLSKFDDLFKAEEKIEESKPEAKKEQGKAAIKIAKSVVIDAEGFMKRLEQVGPTFGSQGGTEVYQKADKTYIYYATDHDQGKNAIYRTILEPFENTKTEKVSDGGGFEMVDNGGKPYMLSGGTIHKYNIETNKLDKLDLSYKFRRNLSGEFNQMFYETWANLDENFYDEDMHGIDWKKIAEQYSAYLPYVNSRSDLRVLLNDMLGELNSSHMGFNSSGSEEQARLTYRTMETGIIFDDEDPLLVSHIVNASNADRKEMDILKGDRLLKVNGEKINKEQDRNYYFT